MTPDLTDNGLMTESVARERVVVALTGRPEGETLLRRAAKLASTIFEPRRVTP